MWNRLNILSTIYIGVISGVILGLLLKWIQTITQVNVYTLLLNVDFIPFFGRIQWQEPMEFFFHVLISVLIVFIFVSFVTKYKVEQKSFHLFLASFILCSPTILLYFILSTLAVKDVPEWNDWLAFFYWSVCHLLYIWLLPVLYQKIRIKAERP